LIKKDSLIVKQAIYIGFTVVSSAVLTNILKYSVDRARPAETYPDIDQVIETHSPSFPSGHTSSAFSLATSVSLVYPKWYVIVPAYTWASTVGYSRMALGVHYPSDVFMGAIIGAGSAFVCFKAQQWLDKKSKKDLSIRKKKN
ncbi:MAG: phosphatase PAP2 family protein, partial [Ignavibacteria bacterium]|nr:phosphatase PAP2 family protein [Ignavibacteria bacterium]